MLISPHIIIFQWELPFAKVLWNHRWKVSIQDGVIMISIEIILIIQT